MHAPTIFCTVSSLARKSSLNLSRSALLSDRRASAAFLYADLSPPEKPPAPTRVPRMARGAANGLSTMSTVLMAAFPSSEIRSATREIVVAVMPSAPSASPAKGITRSTAESIPKMSSCGSEFAALLAARTLLYGSPCGEGFILRTFFLASAAFSPISLMLAIELTAPCNIKMGMAAAVITSPESARLEWATRLICVPSRVS